MNNGMTSEPNSRRPLKMSTSYQCIVNDDYEEKNEEYCPFSARRIYANISGKIVPTDAEAFFQESSIVLKFQNM